MRLHVMASEPHFADHLEPVWKALPHGMRGSWLTAQPVMRTILRGKGYRAAMLPAGSDEPVLVASIGDLNRAKRSGWRRIAYMEHGVGQSYGADPRTVNHPSYAGGRGREGCGIILAPNEMAAARWRAAYPSIPVHVIGATRLLAGPGEGARPLLCVSFHWNGGMPEMQNAFTHYWPTLATLAQQLPVIGHGHPRMLGALRPRYRRAGIRFVASLQEVAATATVYAVDNSSTLYELGRTRPVIALNQPAYRKGVEHGLRFWSHVPGPQVENGEQLLATARRLLRQGETEAEQAHRTAVMAEVFPRLDGAQVASRLLVRWLTTGSA